MFFSLATRTFMHKKNQLRPSNYGPFSCPIPHSQFCSVGASATQAKANPKTAIFMLNIGGPTSETEIPQFLERFFSDTSVIRIPFGLGKYIGKLRGPAKITKQYQAIGGFSPLKKWTEAQGELMVSNLDKDNSVYGPHVFFPGFRYSNPLFEESFDKFMAESNYQTVQNIVLFSQYPQYSCTTSGNSLRLALKYIQEKPSTRSFNIKIIDRWYNHPGYINLITEYVQEILTKHSEVLNPKNTFVLFTAHSLPLDFVTQGDVYPFEITNTSESIMAKLPQKFCFRVAWQSKVGFQHWLGPDTLSTFAKISEQGFQNLIIVPLGFTSDHLETLYEIDILHMKSIKEKKWFQNVFRARSFNADPKFAAVLSDIVKKTIETNEYTSPKLLIKCPDCKVPECQVLFDHFKK